MATDDGGQPDLRAAAPESRRSRLRRELTEQILQIARRQLTETGPGSVTWRAIAREVGMNPASLYTYFDSLDDLYTALILESYASLADAVTTAFESIDPSVNEPPPRDRAVQRAMACVHAYRDWALENPAQFNLIFADQIPGYEAPPGGPTVDAEMAVLRPLIAAAGAVAGRRASPDDIESTEPTDADGPIGVWATMHGLVALEINHHLPIPDQPARYDRLMRRSLEGLGDDRPDTIG